MTTNLTFTVNSQLESITNYEIFLFVEIYFLLTCACMHLYLGGKETRAHHCLLGVPRPKAAYAKGTPHFGYFLLVVVFGAKFNIYIY